MVSLLFRGTTVSLTTSALPVLLGVPSAIIVSARRGGDGTEARRAELRLRRRYTMRAEITVSETEADPCNDEQGESICEKSMSKNVQRSCHQWETHRKLYNDGRQRPGLTRP